MSSLYGDYDEPEHYSHENLRATHGNPPPLKAVGFNDGFFLSGSGASGREDGSETVRPMTAPAPVISKSKSSRILNSKSRHAPHQHPNKSTSTLAATLPKNNLLNLNPPTNPHDIAALKMGRQLIYDINDYYNSSPENDDTSSNLNNARFFVDRWLKSFNEDGGDDGSAVGSGGVSGGLIDGYALEMKVRLDKVLYEARNNNRISSDTLSSTELNLKPRPNMKLVNTACLIFDSIINTFHAKIPVLSNLRSVLYDAMFINNVDFDYDFKLRNNHPVSDNERFSSDYYERQRMWHESDAELLLIATRKEVISLQIKVSNFGAGFSDKDTTINSLKLELSESIAKVTQLEVEAVELKKTSEMFSEHKAKLRLMAEKEKEKHRLTKEEYLVRIATVKKLEIDKSTKDAEKFGENSRVLMARLKDLEVSFKTSQGVCKEFEVTVSEKNVVIQSMEEAMEEYKDIVGKDLDEVGLLKLKVQQITKDKVEGWEEIEYLKRKLKNAEDKNFSLVEEINLVKSNFSVTTINNDNLVEVGELNDKLLVIVEEFEEKVREQDVEIERLTNENDAMKNEVSKIIPLQDEMARLFEVQSVGSTNSSSSTANASKNNKNDKKNKNKKTDRCNSDIELEAAKLTLKTTVSKNVSEINKLISEITRLENQFTNEIMSREEKFNGERSDSRAEIQKLREELRVKSREFTDFEGKDKVLQEINKLSEFNEQLRIDNLKLKDDNNDNDERKSELEKDLLNQIDAINLELKDAKIKVVDLESERERLFSLLDVERARIKSEETDAKVSVDPVEVGTDPIAFENTQKSELEEKARSIALTNEHARMKNQNSETNDELTILRSLHATEQNRTTKLHKEVTTLTRTNANLEEICGKLENALSRMSSYDLELSNLGGSVRADFSSGGGSEGEGVIESVSENANESGSGSGVGQVNSEIKEIMHHLKTREKFKRKSREILMLFKAAQGLKGESVGVVEIDVNIVKEAEEVLVEVSEEEVVLIEQKVEVDVIANVDVDEEEVVLVEQKVEVDVIANVDVDEEEVVLVEQKVEVDVIANVDVDEEEVVLVEQKVEVDVIAKVDTVPKTLEIEPVSLPKEVKVDPLADYGSDLTNEQKLAEIITLLHLQNDLSQLPFNTSVIKQISQAGEKIKMLQNSLEDYEGWRQKLYLAGGSVDLEFDVTPYPVKQQVNILMVIKDELIPARDRERDMHAEAFKRLDLRNVVLLKRLKSLEAKNSGDNAGLVGDQTGKIDELKLECESLKGKLDKAKREVREAKQNTTQICRDEAHEQEIEAFAQTINPQMSLADLLQELKQARRHSYRERLAVSELLQTIDNMNDNLAEICVSKDGAREVISDGFEIVGRGGLVYDDGTREKDRESIASLLRPISRGTSELETRVLYDNSKYGLMKRSVNVPETSTNGSLHTPKTRPKSSTTRSAINANNTATGNSRIGPPLLKHTPNLTLPTHINKSMLPYILAKKHQVDILSKFMRKRILFGANFQEYSGRGGELKDLEVFGYVEEMAMNANARLIEHQGKALSLQRHLDNLLLFVRNKNVENGEMAMMAKIKFNGNVRAPMEGWIDVKRGIVEKDFTKIRDVSPIKFAARGEHNVMKGGKSPERRRL